MAYTHSKKTDPGSQKQFTKVEKASEVSNNPYSYALADEIDSSLLYFVSYFHCVAMGKIRPIKLK